MVQEFFFLTRIFKDVRIEKKKRKKKDVRIGDRSTQYLFLPKQTMH